MFAQVQLCKMLETFHLCRTVNVLLLDVSKGCSAARHDNTVTFVFLDPVGAVVGGRHLFYYQQRRRSPPSSRLVFLWRRSKAEGKTERRKAQRREPWQGALRCLPRETGFQRQRLVLWGLQRNMRFRCFKELAPFFPSLLRAEVPLASGRVREENREQARRGREGSVSITTCEMQSHYVTIWEF